MGNCAGSRRAFDPEVQSRMNEEKLAKLSLEELEASARELNKQSLELSDNLMQMETSFDRCQRLHEEEKKLMIQKTQNLKNNLRGLQQNQQILIAEHDDKMEVAKERIKSLEIERTAILSRNQQLEEEAKQDYSVSSIKKEESDGKNKSQSTLERPDSDRMVTDNVAEGTAVTCVCSRNSTCSTINCACCAQKVPCTSSCKCRQVRCSRRYL